ncbi:hypothetical protein [Mucilaginibacter polytrichastri]|uniref:Uncharacterized protein n=1 Tax=Mucilaginibacter polytrichastri TaxID=1302689 RepID=A0A1Q5ZYU0_9SPHI|nr:hypothetical protein [Mucilaginibacter polytrichastri]OKS86908.1 hypothetical protein RG47T_2366 [Mucilaginibacter polytrichastri]SFT17948.1 hypothetical protein SAMN04487890_11491 [Mucilaginibacter polytrichastri]
MKDFEHLMSVWQAQPANDQLSVDEVLKQVKKGIGSITAKLFWGIVAMIALTVYTFVVLFFFTFKLWETYAGISVMFVTMLLYLTLILRHYRILHKRDLTVSPTEYLNTLKEYQKQRAALAGWFYYIYVILISAGLALYLFEILEHASVLKRTMIYSFTIVWVLFLTFYLKRRIFKSEEEKLDLMIERLERLETQFE